MTLEAQMPRMKTSSAGMTRRAFVAGAAAAALGCRSRGVFGIGGDAPRLVCGVASDVHVDCDEHEAAFRRTLEWFRSARVDAVVIAGDLTTGSRIPEFERMAGVWRSVFPRDALPDGSRVERLFVTGNHDTDVLQKFATRAQAEEQSFTFRRAETWARLFGEPYESVFRKDVRGVPFVLKHWYCRKLGETDPVKGYFAAHGGELPRDAPFFYVQHDHPRGTCSWPGAANCCDGGDSTECLSRFPDAIALSGHSHFSIEHETSIWQGAFTSVGTGSTCGWAFTPGGRENGHGGPDPDLRAWEMPCLDFLRCRQAQVMRVYDDRVTFERRDVEFGLSLGADRVVPLGPGAARPYAFAPRAAAESAPQFPDGAEPRVFRIQSGRDRAGHAHEQICVAFPTVSGLGGGARAFDYLVEAQTRAAGGEWRTVAERSVFSQGALLPAERDERECRCVFAAAHLPSGEVRFVVRPRGEWGSCGAPLSAALDCFET
ncbi:MAG: metallophosphoesterase [Kiritimatiellae bacterium]|nr:metallophosphoesterase [Kiritimatiellia bacterium]